MVTRATKGRGHQLRDAAVLAGCVPLAPCPRPPASLNYSLQDMTSKFPTEMKGQDSGTACQNFWEFAKSS